MGDNDWEGRESHECSLTSGNTWLECYLNLTIEGEWEQGGTTHRKEAFLLSKQYDGHLNGKEAVRM